MTTTTWRAHGPRFWRHPLALLAATELGYLLFFHVAVSVPHTPALFTWLPLGRWALRGPQTLASSYALCLGLLFVVYAALLRDLTRRAESRRDRRVVFWGAALVCVTLIFLPRMLSKDLFDYMGHARVLTVHHANPFTTPAGEFPGDAFTDAMGWAGATPLYGPAWASTGAVLALLGGGSFLGTVVAFKLFFAAAHLLNGWLILRIAGSWPADAARPMRPLRAAAFYLWNPLVLTQTVGDAHNDVVVLFWLLLGIRLIQRGDDLLGAACAAMSVMMKYVTAPVALPLAMVQWRGRGAARAAMFAGVCALVAVVAYAPYLSGFEASHFLRPYQHSSYQGSFMMLIEMALSHLLQGANTPGSPLARILLVVTIALAGAVGVWYLRACWRAATLMDAVETGTRLLLLYLLLVTALLRTSYLVWIVGLAAIVASVTLRRAVAIFSCTALALEVLWVWRILQPDPAAPASVPRFAASAVAVGVPILYLLLHSRGWPMAWWRWARSGAGRGEAV